MLHAQNNVRPAKSPFPFSHRALAGLLVSLLMRTMVQDCSCVSWSQPRCPSPLRGWVSCNEASRTCWKWHHEKQNESNGLSENGRGADICACCFPAGFSWVSGSQGQHWKAWTLGEKGKSYFLQISQTEKKGPSFFSFIRVNSWKDPGTMYRPPSFRESIPFLSLSITFLTVLAEGGDHGYHTWVHFLG